MFFLQPLQLEEMSREKIDPSLKEEVSFQNEKDLFLSFVFVSLQQSVPFPKRKKS